MQAVILAAGKGTRLRPLTHNIPKTLIPIAGKPILVHIIHALPKHIREIILVVGYKEGHIRKYIGSSFAGRKIVYVRQENQHGTAHALSTARVYLKPGPFMLLGGDDLYHKDDLQTCAQKHPSILAAHSLHPERFGVCIVKKGCLHGIIEKPERPQSSLVNTGVYVLDHDIFDVPAPMLSNGELNLAEQVGRYAQKRPVFVHETRFWYPINNHEELALAEQALKNL